MYDVFSADDLLIGKGIFYFAPLVGGVYQPFYDMGNVREGGPTNADDRLDVKSARSAAAPSLKNLLRSRTITWRVLFESFMKENLRKITMSTTGTIAAQAATPVVAEVLRADVPAATLGAALGGAVFFTALYGPATAIVLDVGATQLVEGTDYVISQNVRGRVAITILPGSTVVTNGTDDLTIDYTPTAYAAGFDTLNLGQATEIEGAVRFIGDPASGRAIHMDVWKVSVNPTGVLGLISENISQGELSFTVLEDAANHPTNPLGQAVIMPAA